MILESKLSKRIMTLGDRCAAAAFILAIPEGEPFGIQVLPGYVFEYIYEHGTLEDLPWITLQDTDTEARIIKFIKSDDPVTVARWCMNSPLFIAIGLDPFIRALYLEQIGRVKFETAVRYHLNTYKSPL